MHDADNGQRAKGLDSYDPTRAMAQSQHFPKPDRLLIFPGIFSPRR
jgi:hypothetical protein